MQCCVQLQCIKISLEKWIHIFIYSNPIKKGIWYIFSSPRKHPKYKHITPNKRTLYLHILFLCYLVDWFRRVLTWKIWDFFLLTFFYLPWITQFVQDLWRLPPIFTVFGMRKGRAWSMVSSLSLPHLVIISPEIRGTLSATLPEAGPIQPILAGIIRLGAYFSRPALGQLSS